MATKSNKGSSVQTELMFLGTRSTLSPDEAVRYLSVNANINLAPDALWSYVLESHLLLSIEFDVAAFGRRGRIVSRVADHDISSPPQRLDKLTFVFGGEPEPLKAEVRAFGTELVVELDEGSTERLQGTWDLCRAGDWQEIVRDFRRGTPSFDNALDRILDGLGSVFVTKPGEPDLAWELSDRSGKSTQRFPHQARPVFRRDALEGFLHSFLEPEQASEYQGELSMTTLLQMVGALIEADGSRKKVLFDLLTANFRGFGERSLDKYLAAATDEYEKARRRRQANNK